MTEETHAGDYVEAAAPVDYDNGDHTQAESRQVPLDALEAERAQRQQLQEELRMIKDHLSLMQTSRQPEPKGELDSLQDDDVLTVGEAKKFISNLNNQYKASLDEIKISQRHPDYSEVITKYLPEVIKQNPSLHDSLLKTKDYELAYHLAKSSESYRKVHKKASVNKDAERIIENSQRAGSLSSVGQNSPISEARRWKDMSDDDFRQQVAKNMGYSY